MFPFNKKVVLTVAAIVASLSIVSVFMSQKEDPLIEIMAILDDQTNKCREELSKGGAEEQCAIMLEVGDRIFGGNATRWGEDMIGLGYLTATNIKQVNTILQAHVVTMRAVRESLEAGRNSEKYNTI